MINMILKCITNEFPGRVTYGKEYRVIRKSGNYYHIIDDNNKLASVSPDSFTRKYFICLVKENTEVFSFCDEFGNYTKNIKKV